MVRLGNAFNATDITAGPVAGLFPVADKLGTLCDDHISSASSRTHWRIL
jgi:hypothetical protein